MSKTVKQTFRKFWNIKPAVKNETGLVEAEILIYGYIVAYKWWDEDEDITSKELDQELKALGDVDLLNVRINSGGGDIFEAQAMYSMLKRHPAIKHVYIDGLAASAASVVAMAGDKIIMPIGSMMMIHNPVTLAWGDENEMRKTAEMLAKVRDTIIAVYKTKTTKTEDEIKKMMNAETWMTANDAIELGFADEIEKDEPVETVQNGKIIVINGIEHDLSRYKNVPQFINKPNLTVAASVNVPGLAYEKEEKIMDLKELKEKHPEIYDEVFNLGVMAERERMKAIDELSIPGYDDIVNKAKYETGITAEKLAVELIKAEKQRGKDFLEQRKQDVESSKVNNVDGVAAPIESEDEEEKIVNKVVEGANTKRGRMNK